MNQQSKIILEDLKIIALDQDLAHFLTAVVQILNASVLRATGSLFPLINAATVA